MENSQYKNLKWWLIGQAILVIGAAFIAYGVARADINNNTDDINEMKKNKASIESVTYINGNIEIIKEDVKEIKNDVKDIRSNIKDISVEVGKRR